MYLLRLLAAVSALAVCCHCRTHRIKRSFTTLGLAVSWLNSFLAENAWLVPRVEIGDPDAIGYGNGGGAKVPDDPDAVYLDEQK